MDNISAPDKKARLKAFFKLMIYVLAAMLVVYGGLTMYARKAGPVAPPKGSPNNK